MQISNKELAFVTVFGLFVLFFSYHKASDAGDALDNRTEELYDKQDEVNSLQSEIADFDHDIRYIETKIKHIEMSLESHSDNRERMLANYPYEEVKYGIDNVNYQIRNLNRERQDLFAQLEKIRANKVSQTPVIQDAIQNIKGPNPEMKDAELNRHEGNVEFWVGCFIGSICLLVCFCYWFRLTFGVVLGISLWDAFKKG